MKVYTVKPLKWMQEKGRNPTRWRADTIFTTLNIRQDHPLHGKATYRFSFCVDEYYDEGESQHNTLKQAKKAAEKWYWQRLKPALKSMWVD